MGQSAEVDRWFAKYDNPMKEVVQKIREIILAADPRMGECIKWQAPTFEAGGKNLASFFPKSKEHASLMFHEGAKIPGAHARLVGGGETSRVLKLASVREATAARQDLVAIVKAWLGWKIGERPALAKKAATPKQAKRSAKAKRGATRSRARLRR